MKPHTHERPRIGGGVLAAPRKPASVLLAVLVAALCVTLSVPSAAFAEGGGGIASNPPVHTKTITPNDDGTYDLSLTVTGATELSETKTSANVIVVQDVSGSMKSKVYTYSLEKTEKYDWDGTYGMVDGEPVKLERNWGFFGLGAYNYYLDANGKEVKYTGDMYHKVGKETGKTRLDVAKEALNSLADQLIASDDSTIKLSLETFSDRGNTPSQYYTGGQASDFKDAVNGLRAKGGTNWVDALTKANEKAKEDPNTPTYVIFLSDGEPTYGRDRWGNRTGDGTAYDDEYFNNAVDEANKRPSNVAGLFTVYTGSETEQRMNSFAQKTTGGSAFDGTDSEKLNAAFANIIQTITKSASYKDVRIVDKLSEYVTGTAADGAIDPESVSYEKNGEAWAEAPAAKISEDGTLSWDLSSIGELEKGTTYKVTFKVKPSQAAYDAAVNNGEATELPSNDGDGTNVFYKTVLKETGKNDQVSGEKSDSFEVPTFSVPVDTVTVKKEWANTNGAELPGFVTVQLQKDGQDYGDPFQLTAESGWTKEIVVPAGVGQISWSVVETAVDGYDPTYSEAVTGTGVLTVTNTHKTWPGSLDGAANLTVTKNLTGRDWADGDSFTFKLEQTAGDASAVTMPESTELTIDSKTVDHKAAFGDITFSAAGEFEFTITELGQSHDGVTYDQTKNVVKVSVEEKDGKFVAAVTEGANPTFTNTYAAESVTVDGAKNFAFMKKLTGRTLKADEFSFTISSKDAPLPEPTTVTNDKDGNIAFGDITFDKAGVYHYSIAEDTSKLPGGVTPITQGAKQVTVTVTDNGKGQLEAKVDPPKDVIFENAYKPKEAEIKLTAKKIVVASQDKDGVRAPKLEGGKFWFTISSTNNGPLPKPTTVTNDDAGNIAFGAIKFTEPGEYHYTITESGSMDGVTNDTEPKSFTVTVKDIGDGTMTATASEIPGFVNTYTVKPIDYSVTTDVRIAKKLEGRALKAGEFKFQLLDGTKVVSEGTNDADGNVTFDAITYTSSDLGEHTYKVREVAGEAGGVTYDKSEYGVTVEVTDNGDGSLSAKASSDGAIEFKNSYAAEPTSVSFSATKVLDGAELKDGQFSFVLKDNEGNELQTARNAVDGTVSFQPVEFAGPGTHTFTISEVNDDQANVTYDDASYQLTVNVTDDGEGHLSASVDGQAPVFKNTYTAPAQPKDDQKPAQKDQKKSIVPKTGDLTNAVAPVVILVVAAACIVLGFLAKNKKK